MTIHALFSAIAIILTFYAFIPYIRSILLGQIRPHVFSWIIWALTTFVVFLAQLSDNAGTGAWPIGVSAMITCAIAILAYIKKSDNSVTRLDWIFFLIAMSSLPFWYFTADPVWAVLILTSVDIFGFGPTIRKVYYQPNEEQVLFYALFIVRNTFVILALQHYSITTVLFPAATGLACVILIGLILYRRRILN